MPKSSSLGVSNSGFPSAASISTTENANPADALADPHKTTKPKPHKIQVGPQSDARRKVLIKARWKYQKSKDLMNAPPKPKGNKNLVRVHKGPQPKYLADRIDPEALAKGRRELNKLPVYMAARSIEGTNENLRAHGFIAIGRPGVQGAKVFTHFQSDVHAKVVFNQQTVDALANAKNPSTGRAFFGPFQMPRIRRFFESVSRDRGSQEVEFESWADLHRSFFMFQAEEFINDLKDPTLKVDPNASPAVKQRQIKEALGKLKPSDARKFSSRVLRSTNGFLKELDKAAHVVPGLVKDGELRQVTPSGRYKKVVNDRNETKMIPQDHGMNSAEQDARLFESANHADRLELNEQDVSPTDVIEANRLQRLRDQFLDERRSQMTGMKPAPELQYYGSVKSADDAVELFDSVVATTAKTYRGVDEPRDAKGKMVVADIKRARRYEVTHVFSQLKKWVVTKWAKLKSMVTGKPVTRVNFATPGNCNSAAGGLIRLAGELKGQKVKVKAGAFQHGVKVDTYWNPTDPKLAKQKPTAEPPPDTDEPHPDQDPYTLAYTYGRIM